MHLPRLPVAEDWFVELYVVWRLVILGAERRTCDREVAGTSLT